MMFKQNLLLGSKTLLKVPQIGISSHLRICIDTRLSIFSFTQVLSKSETVKDQEDLWHLTLHIHCSRKFCFLGAMVVRRFHSLNVLITSDLWSSLDMLKSSSDQVAEGFTKLNTWYETVDIWKTFWGILN